MTNWKTYKLGNIADIQTGPFGSQLHNKDYAAEGSPIVTVEHLGNRRFTTQNLPLVSDADKARLSKYVLSQGDIVFSRVGSVDRCSYVSDAEDGWMFSGRCLRVRCNREAYPLYVYYYFCLESVKQYVRNVAVGATMPSINTQIMSEIPIPLPSLEEQRRIAGILGAIDDKIENNRRINTNLELQAQALFDKIFFDDNDAERNPLSDYADINPTRTLRQGVVARYIEMANLPTRGSFPSDWSYKSYCGGCKFANGDTIMARITPCLENGKTAYIDFLEEQEVAFGSTEYIVISAKNGYCPALFYFLARNKEFVDYAVGHMNGSSGRQRVSGVDIANFSMPHITLEESNKFAEVVMPMMDVIRNNSLENRHLATLRDTLLPKLMNGEIKIAE